MPTLGLLWGSIVEALVKNGSTVNDAMQAADNAMVGFQQRFAGSIAALTFTAPK